MKRGDSASEFAILGILSIRPGSGYDIKQFVGHSIGHFWSESYGRIYPVLKQLAQRSLIAREKGSRNSGRRARQVYAITRQGEKALRRWLQQRPKTEAPRSELLLKLFFARRIGPHLSAHYVREKKRNVELELAFYEEVKRRIKRDYATHSDLPYWLITLNFGRHRSQAIVAWCNETLKQLSRLEKRKQT